MANNPSNPSARRGNRRTASTGTATKSGAAQDATPATGMHPTDGAGTGTGDAATLLDPRDKVASLDAVRERGDGQPMTTDQGLKITTTDDALKAGDRGPTLIEDFHFREKITHFDHERIPERVVHARGAGAHGYFQVYESMADLTRAAFLQDPSVQTPVFVRFSTVAGSRGSMDTPRDVRGFATKFYTSEGNFDIVGNNIPVFFIQDAIKFPDMVHAIKPEAPDEIPQAGTAHDTAWDFFSLVPESIHMVMWTMSDRAIPRSFRMMEGFGIHTFRMVNAAGTSRFVKFHWKPVLGVHSLVWDEAQKIGGKDSDWNRRDLWDAIEAGTYPEWEFGLQIIEEADEFAFNFDILDPTKIWPEELVPVQRIGKMTLNRNPDNFFAETEQVAFDPGNIVPGIDFSDDPLLQGRLFSYIDTQINRFNSTNFAQTPINRPICPVHNNQFDGFMRQSIHVGRASYFPNSLGGDSPAPVPADQGGFASYPEPVQGRKTRARSESFKDHFTQARFFYKSLSPPEQQHLRDAMHFELGKVKSKTVRENAVAAINNVDGDLAKNVAEWIGVAAPEGDGGTDQTVSFHERKVDTSPALSMANTRKDSIQTRRVAILVADGVDESDVEAVKQALTKGGAVPEVIAKTRGSVSGAKGGDVAVDHSALTVDSVLYDAVYVPGGSKSAETLAKMATMRSFLAEAFAHYKPMAATADGINVLKTAINSGAKLASGNGLVTDLGVVTTTDGAGKGDFTAAFATAIAQHRFWDRPVQD